MALAFVYRALNEFNIDTIKESNGIKVDNNLLAKTLREGFMQINSHLQNGSYKKSCWISCSKDFAFDVEEYSLPQNGSNSPRSSIAVIQNHDTTSMVDHSNIDLFKKYPGTDFKPYMSRIWEMDTPKISKLVFDLSDRKQAKKLGNMGFILTKEGDFCGNNVLVYGYTGKSKEVIVYRSIPQEDITIVLPPVEIDLLYAAAKINDSTGKSTAFESLLDKLIQSQHSIDFKKNLLGLQSQLYTDIYDKNTNLSEIALKVYRSNTKADILAVYHHIRELKRELVKKILQDYFNISETAYVPVPEDTLDIVRIGEFNQCNVVPVKYDNHVLNVKPLPFVEETPPMNYDNVEKVILALNYDNIQPECFEDDKVYWLYEGKITRKYYNEKSTKRKRYDFRNSYEMLRGIIVKE
jgi:hypothetical protein